MTNGSELKGSSARALRAAGYLPLPRYWVTREQMDLILWMARQNEPEVTRIRVEATRQVLAEKAWTRHKQRGAE